MRRRRTNRESGVVLIAVMWGMVVLTAMAFALAALVRTGSEELRARKEHLQAYYLARGGVYRAIAAINTTTMRKEDAPFRSGQRELRWNAASAAARAEGAGEVRIEVMDEGGKLDLNMTPQPVLERLFMNLGLDFRAAHDLAAAIADWRDADSDTRLGGAEEGYYALLPQPYRPANADFTSVEELLLVRGVTTEMFWGRYVVNERGAVERRFGLVDCLTVHSHSTAVNMNYAPVPVLLALPQMSPQVARFIVEGRQKKPFESVNDFTHDYPVLLDGETLSALTTASSGRYTLVAAAAMPSGVSARVRALVQVGGLDTPEQSHRDASGRMVVDQIAMQGPPFLILGWDDSYVR